jgi:hypothetical protein
MRNTLLALAGVLLVGAVLFPTSASPTDGPTVEQQLELEPHPGPNGDYAVVEDGTLGLNFGPSNPKVDGEGVIADSVMPFHNVFTITYTGDQTAEVYLTNDAEGLAFYRGDDPSQSIEGEENAVELAPNETVDVGVLLDTEDGELESVDAFEVHAKLPESGETTTVVTTTQSTGGGGTGGGGTGGGGTGGGGTGGGGTGGGGAETTTAASTTVNTTAAPTTVNTTTAPTTVATTTRTTSPAPTTERTTSPAPTTERTTSPAGGTTTAGTTSQSPTTSTAAPGSTSRSTSENATTSRSPGTEPPTASRPPDDAPPADGNSGSPGLPAFLALLTGTFGLVGVLYWAIAVR